MAKNKVVVKKEKFNGRLGISIYVNDGLCKFVVDAISLFDELEFIADMGTMEVTYVNDYDGTSDFDGHGKLNKGVKNGN